MSRPPRKSKPSRLALSDLGGQLDELELSLAPENAGRWPWRGLGTAFPLMTSALDGFRNYLYVFAGGSRMGKSTLLLQLAYDMLRLDETARALFVSLDQPVRDMQLRLVGMAGQCHLDYLLDPDPSREERYEKKKTAGLERVRALGGRLHLVDESQGAVSIDELEEMVAELRQGDDGPLMVFVDPVFKLRTQLPPAADLDERTGHLAARLKTLCMKERVGVLVSTRLQSGAGSRRPELQDLEEQASLMYEAAGIMLLYADAVNDGDTPFLEWEWGTDDLMVPIFELDLVKNKMGAATGRLFYRFYQSFSKFKECSELEVDNFRRMLENLRRHSGESEARELELPRVEDVSGALPDAAIREKV